MSQTWRDRAEDVIREVRQAHPRASGEELKKLLREAYPFGQRKYHPYTVWCESVREALGMPRHWLREKPIEELPLFEGREWHEYPKERNDGNT